jgi:hypothetical protein
VHHAGEQHVNNSALKLACNYMGLFAPILLLTIAGIGHAIARILCLCRSFTVGGDGHVQNAHRYLV